MFDKITDLWGGTDIKGCAGKSARGAVALMKAWSRSDLETRLFNSEVTNATEDIKDDGSLSHVQ